MRTCASPRVPGDRRGFLAPFSNGGASHSNHFPARSVEKGRSRMRISLLFFASIAVASGIGIVALSRANSDGPSLAMPRSDALAGAHGMTSWKGGRRLRERCQRESASAALGSIDGVRPVANTCPGIDPECELYSLGTRRRRRSLVLHPSPDRQRFVAATSGVRSPLLAS